MINNMKVNKILTYKELINKFIKINTGVKVVEWQPMIGDECKAYADESQPILRVELEDGNWLRVFVSKEYSEINWY